MASKMELSKGSAAHIRVRSGSLMKPLPEIRSQVETVKRRNITEVPKRSVLLIESGVPDADPLYV
jgi:hypothetical protein